ncbi:MAG: flippase-like domain-containing protein [Oscillospiraceae bacterium]|nr:flippase-like domain-containing protein [Oscillospiraceae bacterium]
MGMVSMQVIILLVGLQIISQILVNLQWCKIAKFANVPISFRDMLYINAQGSVMDSITPGVKIGGEITRAVQMSRKCGIEKGQSAAIVATQKLFSISAFLLLCLLTVGFLQAQYTQYVVYGILALVVLILLAALFMPKRWRNIFAEQAKFLRQNPKTSLMFFGLSLLIWLIYPVKMYILAAQFLPDVNIIYIAGITFVSYMVGMIPIFPGGLGGFEGTMTGLLLTLGFSVSGAALVAVLFRFITFWLVMILSFGFIAFCKIRNRGARRWVKTS